MEAAAAVPTQKDAMTMEKGRRTPQGPVEDIFIVIIDACVPAGTRGGVRHWRKASQTSLIFVDQLLSNVPWADFGETFVGLLVSPTLCQRRAVWRVRLW